MEVAVIILLLYDRKRILHYLHQIALVIFIKIITGKPRHIYILLFLLHEISSGCYALFSYSPLVVAMLHSKAELILELFFVELFFSKEKFWFEIDQLILTIQKRKQFPL